MINLITEFHRLETQNSVEVFNKIELAQKIGFKNINIDLIYGVSEDIEKVKNDILVITNFVDSLNLDRYFKGGK